MHTARIGRHLGPELAVFLSAGLCCSQVFGQTSQARTIDCPTATQLAGQAYERVYDALQNNDVLKAYAMKDEFWDIESRSGQCADVQKMASALKDHRLGRNDTAPVIVSGGTMGASGSGGTSASGNSGGTSGTSGTGTASGSSGQK